MPDDQIGVFEARTRFSELVRRVEAGESITITRNGHAVARLAPAEPRRSGPELLAELREMTRDVRPVSDETIRRWIEEGRK